MPARSGPLPRQHRTLEWNAQADPHAAIAAFASVASVGAAGSAGSGPTRVLQLTRASYAGVRCAAGNSIACDRISLAVWPAGEPTHLIATIAGHQITLQPPPPDSGADYWQGTLENAGLLTPGPLRVIPDRGRFYWAGRHPRPFTLKLSARYRGKPDAQTRVRVMLHPGWG